MKPVDAAARFLAECVQPFRDELEKHGVTVTVESTTDAKGAVVCSYTFFLPAGLAEKLASDPV
jgi:hypothetical protein